MRSIAPCCSFLVASLFLLWLNPSATSLLRARSHSAAESKLASTPVGSVAHSVPQCFCFVNRRHHQIPADQSEGGGVAEVHSFALISVTSVLDFIKRFSSTAACSSSSSNPNPIALETCCPI
jgi:hypothetical protein